MKHSKHNFDSSYAVNNTKIVLMPSTRLETFSTTILNYHMISELMDSVDKIRVREGQIKAHQPQIMTPEHYAKSLLEGFADEAQEYADWLRENAKDLHILQYGFTIKKREISEHIISDPLETVVERVKESVQEKNDPMAGVVVGVDKPWEVCLLKLLVDVIRSSLPGNVQELNRNKMFSEVDGVPRHLRHEIDSAFCAAAADPSLISGLGDKLRRCDLFEEYQDRFFALVRASGVK